MMLSRFESVYSAIFPFQFFTSEPYACEPADLPKYPPSKEIDAKRRDEETRRFVTFSL
jgi:cyclin-dependent kinase 12/13